MIKLEKLNEIVKTLDGIPVADITKNRSMTYRSALVSVCEMHKPSTPGSGEALRAFNLGMKLIDVKDSIELEDEEVKFLKGIVDQSTIFLSVVIGRLIRYLNNVLGVKVDQ